MLCQDFERLLNERIDARDQAVPECDALLSAHASSCASCGRIAARYGVLREALRAATPPAAPIGFADRFLAELPPLGADVVPLGWRPRRILAPLGAVAAVLLVALVGWPLLDTRQAPPAGPLARVERPVDVPSLTEALATAGAATWSLAVETSAPAARVSREMFRAEGLVSASDSLLLPVPAAPAADVLQTVGDRVTEGVRPLSNSAQHAFGFLFGITGDAAEPAPRSAKGA